MNTDTHEIKSAADAVREGGHAIDCPVHDHEECVRRIVRDEREREEMERDARRLRELKTVGILVLVTVCLGAVAGLVGQERGLGLGKEQR